jgi:hypothetical protein
MWILAIVMSFGIYNEYDVAIAIGCGIHYIWIVINIRKQWALEYACSG